MEFTESAIEFFLNLPEIHKQTVIEFIRRNEGAVVADKLERIDMNFKSKGTITRKE